MVSKKRLSLQDVLNACLESDNERSDLEINSDGSLNENSSEEIKLPQLIKNFDEERAVFRDSVFLPPTSPPPTTEDYVAAQKRKKSATTTTNYYFLLDFSINLILSSFVICG